MPRQFAHSSVKLPSGVKPLSESLVNVYIPIREEFGEKEFKDVPVRILRSSAASGVADRSPDKVTLVLKGSKLSLEKLTPETLLAYVDLADLKKGDYDLLLQVVLPENVSLKDKEPIKIKAEGWLARIFQHEIDHLDGILYTDRASQVWQPTPEERETIKD
jgi:YbbR domain-containing protein